MKNKQNMPLSTVLSVDTLNSLHHFNLAGKQSKGELHDFYELVYVEEGFYYVILDGERIVVPPSSCIVFAPNAFHSDDGIVKATATVRIVSFESASPEMHYFDNRILTPSTTDLAGLIDFFTECEQLCVHPPQQGGLCARDGVCAHQLQKIKSKLELFLLSQYQANDIKPLSHRKQYRKACFAEISSYLKAHLQESITCASLAAACGLSESVLKSLCREFCGCGPIDYLISLRLNAAKRLIRQSSMSFTEIATATGFGSLHYFSRTFKAHTGKTPTAYAKAP